MADINDVQLWMSFRSQCEIAVDRVYKRLVSEKFHNYLMGLLAKETVGSDNYKALFVYTCALQILAKEPLDPANNNFLGAAITEADLHLKEWFLSKDITAANVESVANDLVMHHCYPDYKHFFNKFKDFLETDGKNYAAERAMPIMEKGSILYIYLDFGYYELG